MDESSSGFDLPIRIDYRSPVWCDLIIAISHIGAVFCIIFSSLPLLIKLLLINLVFIKLVAWILSYIRKSNSKLLLLLNKENEWHISTSGNSRVRVSLKSASILFPEMIFLRLVDSKNTAYELILTRNSANSETLRRLRVRLYFPRA